jgi:hypothetical protein
MRAAFDRHLITTGTVQAGDRGRLGLPRRARAREAGNLALAEALELVCLYAEAEPAKVEKAALPLSSVARRRSAILLA